MYSSIVREFSSSLTVGNRRSLVTLVNTQTLGNRASNLLSATMLHYK